MSSKIISSFLSGVALAFLFFGQPYVFLFLSLILALFYTPYLLIFAALIYDIAFASWNFDFVFFSLLIILTSLMASFVRRRFLW